MKSIYSIICIGFSVLFLSNTGCHKESNTQNLCQQEVDFSKDNWIKKKLSFFNWEYQDYHVNDNLITDVYKITYNNNWYFVLEFDDETLYFYQCDGSEIDQTENSSLIDQLSAAQNEKIWPLSDLNTGFGNGGSAW